MTIDADLLAYYAKVAETFPELPADTDVEPLAVRRQFANVARAFATPRPAGVDVQEMVLPLSGRELRARVYRPAQASKPLPLVMYLHGGGWVVGDLDTHDLMIARFAANSHCAVVSVDYRMAPEFPFPAPVDDAIDALWWLAEHRSRLGFATNRLGVAGDSAGAHLAAVAARAANDRVAGLVTAQLLLYPVARCRFEGGSYTANAEGPGLTVEEMRWYWAQFLTAQPPADDDVRAFPLAESYDRTPARALIVAAAYDPLYDDAHEFARFFEANGGRAEVIDAHDMTHGFGRVQAHSKAAEAWMKKTANRFGEMLHAAR